MDPLKMPGLPDIARRLNNMPPITSPVVRTNELLQMLLAEQIQTNQLLSKIAEKMDA